MNTILGFLRNEIANETNPQAIFNIKDKEEIGPLIKDKEEIGPLIKPSGQPLVKLEKTSVPEITKTGFFQINGLDIDLRKLNSGYSGKDSSYKVTDLNNFLKKLKIPYSSMNKSQKVDRLRQEILKINPNIVFD